MTWRVLELRDAILGHVASWGDRLSPCSNFRTLEPSCQDSRSDQDPRGAARRIHSRNIAHPATDSAQATKLASTASRAEPADWTAKYTAPMAATPAALATCVVVP